MKNEVGTYLRDRVIRNINKVLTRKGGSKTLAKQERHCKQRELVAQDVCKPNAKNKNEYNKIKWKLSISYS